MRVLHLLQSDKYSGAESVVCQIIDLFKEEPYFEMIYVSPDGSIREALHQRGISFFPLKKFSQQEIYRALNTLKPDIIHAHDFNASVRVSNYKKAKIISHIHNNPKWLPKICVNSVAYAFTASRYNKIVGVSDAILNEYIFQKKIESKFICLNNVVDSDAVIRQSENGSVSPIDILYIGRLSEPKNPIGFLRIIKKIIDISEYKPKVDMLGVGPLQKECEKFIQDNCMSDFVSMRGFNSNPYKYMKATKLLIMPSIYEGFGLVAVEAMILGKPVIASSVGGLKDILGDGGGILCETEDEFVEKTINLLQNKKEREIIGSNARNRSKRYTDKDNYKKTLMGLYLD